MTCARGAAMRLLGLALLFALNVGPAHAQSEAAFSLRPANPDPTHPATQSYFILEAAAGTTKSDEVLVLNSGAEPITVDLYAVDALTGATTGAVYATQGTAPTGPGTWIMLPRAQITVPASSTARLPFDVNVPPGIRAGQHLAGIVAQPVAAATTRPIGKDSQFTLTTTTRVVVAVAVTVPGPLERKIAVTQVRTASGMGGTQLLVGVRNEGDVLVKPRGRLVLRSSAGAEVADLPLEINTILPGGSAEYAVGWPRDLAAGDYSLEAVLDTTDALPVALSPAAAGPGAQAASTPVPGHAEFRSSQPLVVKPVPSDIPTLAAGATPGSVVARRAPAEPTVETDLRWVPVAIAGLLVLLAANAGAVALFLRRAQRSSAGAAPAPRIASAAVPPPPAALTGSAGRPAPPVRSGTEAHLTVARPSAPRSLPRPVERAPVFVKGRARTLYLVQYGVKRPFASWAAFIAHGGKPTLANVRLLPEDALAVIPEGQPIEESRSA